VILSGIGVVRAERNDTCSSPSDQFTAPSLRSSVRDGYRFLYGTIRQFLDADVRKAPGSAPTAGRTIKVAGHADAPAATGEEFEGLVMNGSIDQTVCAQG
jgi:hypothetical protein